MDLLLLQNTKVNDVKLNLGLHYPLVLVQLKFSVVISSIQHNKCCDSHLSYTRHISNDIIL